MKVIEGTRTPTADRLVGINDAAHALGYSPKTIRKLVDQGTLPVVRLVRGGRLRFRVRDVERLIADGLTDKEEPDADL
jgi:excisionase family DNA binding protein